MLIHCNRCEGTGFVNIHQLPDAVDVYNPEVVLAWIEAQTEPHDVQVCDCCGDGEQWDSEPGEHSGDGPFDCG